MYNKILQCEECGLYYDNEEDIENIDETGVCIDCDNQFECIIK